MNETVVIPQNSHVDHNSSDEDENQAEKWEVLSLQHKKSH